MRGNTWIYFLLLAAVSCDDFQLYENTPVGNGQLSITSLTPARGPLRGDTLTIIGSGFNPVPYQNTVNFAAQVEERPYVNDKGEVTDSILYVVVQLTPSARVVDATPTSLKVIVPDATVTGPVLVSFGVDTIASPQTFELISTLKRPVITAIDPEFGSPGTQLVMSGVYFVESMVASFGGTYVPVSNPGSTSNLVFRVPSVFSGPTDLRVGSITESNDTLWSSSVNFGVLPSPRAVPFMLATVSGQGIGQAEVVDGRTDISYYDVDLDEDITPQGISLSADSSLVYWINHRFAGAGDVYSSILRGTVAAGEGNDHRTEFGLNVIFYDLTVDGNFLYVSTNRNIRRFRLVNGDITLPAQVVFTPPGSDIAITNLKLVVNGSTKTFYWCDKGKKKIYRGVLNGNVITTAELLYDVESDGLQNPGAIAVDASTGSLYIADIMPEGSTILKGDITGTTPLSVFYTREDDRTGFTDLEMDAVNKYLYWSLGNASGNPENGVYRKTTQTATGRPEPVFQFAAPNYFDF